MTKNVTITIANDYSKCPAGRFVTDGPNSGERFRNDLLGPALRDNDRVTVIIDGVEGYGSSFLEEAFGGLVRELKFKKDDIKNRLAVTYKDQAFKMYSDMIWEYVGQA
jgi:hypothetical protein